MGCIIAGHDLPHYGMNGGDGTYSYVQNSSYQRGALDAANPIIMEEIAKNFDFKHVASAFCIADFGCSTGHNSFPAMQIILDAIKKKQISLNLIKKTPPISEYFMLFNDCVLNDFNTLFRSLPAHKDYHAAGLPGDFHRRLLPASSLHFAYSSWSLQWLTETPKVSNRGRILQSEDRKEVCDAYLEQFEKDMKAFLEARAAEIVEGGLMALLIPGVPASWNPQTEFTIPSDVNLLGSCLMDMAEKGRISKRKTDSFNLPIYFTTPEQLKSILQRSKAFSIQRMEIINNPGKQTLCGVEEHAAFYRAVYEGLLTHHFGAEIIDELFNLYTDKLAASPVYLNPDNDRSIVILAVLKRQMD